MMPGGIALALILCVTVTAVYWFLQFRIVLPLAKKLRSLEAHISDVGDFSQEMLHAHRLPATPQSFSDSVEYAVDRYLARSRRSNLIVWMKRGDTGAFAASTQEIICRTGTFASLDVKELALADAVWKRVFDAQGGQVPAADLPGPLAHPFGRGEKTEAILLPWGTPGKLWGVVALLEPGGPHAAAPVRHDGLDILAAYFGSLADRAAQFWELNRAREQLEGGLSVTMARLDETNMQLIQRAKEMNTLEEITDAISSQADTPGSLKSIVSIVARSLEADLCVFLLLDEAKGELVTQPGAYGLAGDEGSLYRISLQTEEASSVRVFLTGKPFMTGDAQNDPQVIAHFARLWKCHSLIVVPLTVEGRRLGVMRVGSFKRDFFTPDHVKFVRVIAEEAAVLVETTTLTDKLASTNRELAKLHSLKDDFVSTVSHEFKTPLTSIKGFIAILLEQEVGPITKEQKRFLKIVASAADRLGHLVTDMLDMSRLEGGVHIERKVIDLEQVARISVENQRYVAEDRGIRLVLEVPPLLPTALGNSEWVRHVFDNLISNALKFTPEKGEITVTLASKGECLMATVSDTGIGIPEGDREHIFEKFYRATNRQSIKASGTGLGLAICKSIIDKHEGRIWFESGDNGGTEFHFVLPVAKESAAIPANG